MVMVYKHSFIQSSMVAILTSMVLPMVFAKTVLVIDASGSMQEMLPNDTMSKIEAAKEAAREIVSKSNEPIALMVYTDCDEYGDPYSGPIHILENYTVNKYDLMEAIDSIQPSGSTPIGDAVREAITYIQYQGGDRIVVITDGIETCKDENALTDAIQTAQSRGIQVSVIGFGLNQDESEDLKNIVEAGGGRYLEAEDVESLTRALNTSVGNNNTCCCAPLLILVPAILLKVIK